RLLLDRRVHDPARPAARSDLEPGDLPHPEADVPGPAPARAPQPGRLPGLHPRLHHDPAAGLRDGLRGRTAAPAQDLGDEMSRLAHLLAAPLLVATLAASAPAPADDGDDVARQAVRVDAWASSDADGNDTRRLALGWGVVRRGRDHWWGAKVERAEFSGDGWHRHEERAYLSAAGDLGTWRWLGDLGSNGDDLVGRASLHSLDARRKEVFIERDTLETRRGVAAGWVHTFAGATVDLP